MIVIPIRESGSIFKKRKILVSIIILVFITLGTTGCDESTILEDEDVALIRLYLEENLEDEVNSGNLFSLEEFHYDAGLNKILARIDMQPDPSHEAEYEPSEWAETWAWSIVEMNYDLDEKYSVEVELITKDKGEPISWGMAIYDVETEEYTFKK